MDEHEGETYESTDPRDNGRRIKIGENLADYTGRYRYVTVANEGNPKAVGRKGLIKGSTLSSSKWRKVSH